MNGKSYIDGIDLFTFGVYVADYAPLLQYPPLKKVEFNSWPEEDGIEPDLSAPALDARSVTIQFWSVDSDRMGFFFDAMNDGAYHDFHFADLGRTYNLRLLSEPSRAVLESLERFSLTFSDDSPQDPEYINPGPLGTGVVSQGFMMDGIDFASYGLAILDGSLNSIYKAAETKRNLTRNIQKVPGQTYDGEFLFYKEKEVTINLAMIAHDMASFWRNYDSFLDNLAKPEERELYVPYTGQIFPCFYKSSAAQAMHLTGGPILYKFSINLVFTASRRTGPTYTILGVEDGSVLTTEAEQAIDLYYANN